MKENFVPFEIAQKLKEIGFDENCFAGYDIESNLCYPSAQRRNQTTFPRIYKETCQQNRHIIKAPLYQQVFEWFRNRGYNSHFKIDRFYGQDEYGFYCGTGYSDSIGGRIGYETYREAEDACILEMINMIITNKNKNEPDCN